MDSERTDAGTPEQATSTEQQPAEPSVAWETNLAAPSPDRAARRGLHVLRVLVGAAVVFLVMSVLYGFNNAIMITAFAVICTAGLSLILIIPGCWLAGWVTIAVWEAIARGWAARTAH